jgi:hypothetical protein
MARYKKLIVVVVGGVVFFASLFLLSFTTTKTVDVASDARPASADMVNDDNGADVLDIMPPDGEQATQSISPLSGLPCEQYRRRPYAVMISGDKIARPLAGIAQADMVIEMPVITGSITRFMAIFLCNDPEVIGSVRSARHDFIPLAAGLDAVFVHWGGSHFALEKLSEKIVDNIDALENPANTFYRERNAPPAPHNGFTSAERVANAIERLKHRKESNLESYRFFDAAEIKDQKSEFLEKQLCALSPGGCAVTILHPASYRVEYLYDAERNTYARERGGSPEMDYNTKSQVRASNIVIMIAGMRQIEGQYNDVDVEGEGKLLLFQNGRKIEGMWKKNVDDIRSKLNFFDGIGNELSLTPGQTWIEIIESERYVQSDFK